MSATAAVVLLLGALGKASPCSGSWRGFPARAACRGSAFPCSSRRWVSAWGDSSPDSCAGTGERTPWPGAWSWRPNWGSSGRRCPVPAAASVARDFAAALRGGVPVSGGKKAAVLLLVSCVCSWPGSRALAAEEDALYEKSGAQSLYDSLDGDTKEMLSWAGVEGAMVGGDLGAYGLGRGSLNGRGSSWGSPSGPWRAWWRWRLLCRLAGCFEGSTWGRPRPWWKPGLRRPAAGAPAGSAPAGGGPGPKRLGLFGGQRSVYAGLLLAGGASVTGASYSFLPWPRGTGSPCW